MMETQYEALRRQGISRRSFLQFCSLTAASLGLGSAGAKDIAEAMLFLARSEYTTGQVISVDGGFII